MSKIKVGIIGLGVGEQHIEGYQKHPDCEVTALCDFSKEKLAMAREKYPDKKITDNANEILEDPEINVVSIASYDNYHYEQIVKAIEHDKHIFVEKPLCLYEDHAKYIKSLLKKKQLKMSSNLILRKCPRFRLVQKLIKEGKFGRLFHIESDYNYGRLNKITGGWRGKIDFYSVILGGGIHIIDLMLWLVGEDIDEVAAYGNSIASEKTNFRYNDMVVSVLKFNNGMVGKISANFGCIMPHFHSLSIYGTNATFINGLEYGMLFESRDPADGYKKITTPFPGVHKGDFLFGFVDSILNGSRDEVSQDDIFKSMSVCFAIEKAANQSTSVKVNYL